MFFDNIKIYSSLKPKMLVSTFGLALLVILILNLFFVLQLIESNIHNPYFNISAFKINRGYLVLCGKKFGMKIISNIVLLIFIWVLMLTHTLKSINKKNTLFFF